MNGTETTLTVNDEETDKRLMVARIIRSTALSGDHTRKADATFVALGLAQYSPRANSAYILDVSSLLEDIAAAARISLSGSDIDNNGLEYAAATALRTAIDTAKDTYCSRVEESEIVPQPAPVTVEPVNVAELLDTWGYSGTFPPAGTDEVDKARFALIREAVEFGIQNNFCSELEDVVHAAGLGDYLPARRKTVTATIPRTDTEDGTATVAIDIECDRLGVPRDLEDMLAPKLVEHYRANGGLAIIDV